MLLYDDCAIVEPVDAAGQPVVPGVAADKLLVTPLNRLTLPVIRYELTDQLTVLDEPASCGATFTRASVVAGRLDDQFLYAGGLIVHPHVFRTVLGRDPAVREYQVRQTGRGADVAVLATDAVDAGDLAGRIAERLARLGLAEPEVHVSRVEQLERSGSAAKLRRFVPLPASDA
jgi:phenylacetate-coenzyme A ligase PaaK-like adenylate-forming protein